MDKSQEILSQVTVFNKYAKYIPELQRRETWDELCDRNVAMHVKKFPQLKAEIQGVYNRFVRTKKVLPSMRSLQFAGLPIELNNSRIYNCSYLPVEHPAAFSETMFLLLGGTGVGFSVQQRHTSQLPTVQGPKDRPRKFLVSDNIEGWADAVKVLMEAYFYGKSDPVFDFRDIRPKGARLITSGGKAPGPDPLRVCLDKLRSVLNNAVGRKLTSLEAHDILCHIADAVLAGGIRRAAMISLFDKEDMDMLTCKSGDWWELNPQRGRANNSVVLDRSEVTKEEFLDIWERVVESKAGEPGVYWTNDKDWGTNP
jgi:ribonucleoside-diphosphate reductase alpha chain